MMIELLKESGLFTYEKGIREKFWNRVIFPIMDINNKVIALVPCYGRWK